MIGQQGSAKNTVVHPEDRALQGCNLSAAVNSNTAALGGPVKAGPPSCGIDRNAKNPGGFGGQSPLRQPHLFEYSPIDNNPRQKCVSFFGKAAFHAEPIH